MADHDRHVCKAIPRRRPAGKARRLERVYNKNVLTFYRAVKHWFRVTQDLIRSRLRQDAGPMQKADAADAIVNVIPWDKVDAQGRAIIGPHQVRVYGQAMGQAAEMAKVKTPWNLANRRAVAWAAENGAALVTQVGEETRAGLRAIVSQGLAEGKTIGEIRREMLAMPGLGLNAPQERALRNYAAGLEARKVRAENVIRGLRGEADAVGATLTQAELVRGAQEALGEGYSAGTVRRIAAGTYDVGPLVAKEAVRKLKYRAEMIARTETAAAVSEGTLEGYGEAAVEQAEFLAADDACHVCAEMNGQLYDLADASGVLPVHPNCRCTWLPVVVPGAVGAAAAEQAGAEAGLEGEEAIGIAPAGLGEVVAEDAAVEVVAPAAEVVAEEAVVEPVIARQATKAELGQLRGAWKEIPEEIRGKAPMGRVDLRIIQEEGRLPLLDGKKLYLNTSDLGARTAKHELYHLKLAGQRVKGLGGADKLLRRLGIPLPVLPEHAEAMLVRGSPQGAAEELVTMLADVYRSGMTKDQFSLLLREGGPAQRITVLRRAGVTDPMPWRSIWTKEEADKVTAEFWRTLRLPKEPKVPVAPSVQGKSAFSTGTIDKTSPLGGGCNDSQIAEIKGDGKGVYKPKSGESKECERGTGKDAIRAGTYYKREVAASVVDKHLGFDIVPETTIKTGPSGIGSVQQFVEGAKDACKLPYDPAQEWRDKLTVFDVLIGNTDRHSGNYMIDTLAAPGTGRAYAIDNGLAFGTNKTVERYYKFAFYSEKLSPSISKELVEKLTALKANWAVVSNDLKGLLSTEEIDAVRRRCNILLNQGGDLKKLVSRLDRYIQDYVE